VIDSLIAPIQSVDFSAEIVHKDTLVMDSLDALLFVSLDVSMEIAPLQIIASVLMDGKEPVVPKQFQANLRSHFRAVLQPQEARSEFMSESQLELLSF